MSHCGVQIQPTPPRRLEFYLFIMKKDENHEKRKSSTSEIGTYLCERSRLMWKHYRWQLCMRCDFSRTFRASHNHLQVLRWVFRPQTAESINPTFLNLAQILNLDLWNKCVSISSGFRPYTDFDDVLYDLDLAHFKADYCSLHRRQNARHPNFGAHCYVLFLRS